MSLHCRPMRTHGLTSSRRITPELSRYRSPPENRGRRESRVPAAPAASCAKVESTRVSRHRFTGAPGLPCAMVLTVSFVLAPETGLVVSVGDNARALHRISASGYQAHTTSPSEVRALRQPRKSRPSHPAPTFVTIAKRPLYRARDGRAYKDDLPDGTSEILTAPATSDFARRPVLSEGFASSLYGKLSHHSALIWAALMIGHHFSISAFCKAPRACGPC